MSEKRRIVLIGVAALVIVAVSLYLLLSHEGEKSEQYTDDAYIEADMTVVAPRISGVINTVAVTDYQAVKSGDPLVTLDDRDQKVVLAQAQAGLEKAVATVGVLENRIAQQSSEVAEARAVIGIDKANLKLAQADFHRFDNLAREGSGTRQNAQRASAHLAEVKATLARDQAALSTASHAVDVLTSRLQVAKAEQKDAQAAVDNAKLQLSYTRITAPSAGVVAQRSARVGGFTHAGERLLTLVPLDKIYVEANYREVQMTHMQPGQAVTVTVDAFPDMKINGKVARLGPASDVSFSPVPPHNATGNFTKIVQRLPVRIELEATPEQLSRLKVGMSVETRVQVK